MLRETVIMCLTLVSSFSPVLSQPLTQDVRGILQELREGQKRTEEHLTNLEVRLARVEEGLKAIDGRIDGLEKRFDSQFGSFEKRLDSEVGGLRWIMVLLIAIGLIPVVSKIFERKERVEYETLKRQVEELQKTVRQILERPS